MELEILIVDDVLEHAQSAANIISEIQNVKITIVTDPYEALKLIERDPLRFALILSDLNLEIKGFDGVALAAKVIEINPLQIFAIFSGDESLEAPMKCVGTQVVEFIKKTSPAPLLQKKVQNLLKKYLVINKPLVVAKNGVENIAICEGIGLVSKSAKMASMADVVKRVATRDNVTCLIRGGSGSGKELVAKAIHNLSARASKPFVAINMGSFQPTLIESELFGHEKGSFTGASEDRKGAFERAEGGTIFLDEIGELALDLQVKLLRVLQEREVQSVGGNKVKKIDVRVIAATHVNLEKQIKEGKFRLDLYQRLDVISIHIPSLKERTEDVELLAKHFLKKLKSKKTLAHDTIRTLQDYSWPGNVRELEHVLTKADLASDESIITPSHLPSKVFDTEDESDRHKQFDLNVPHREMAQNLESHERDYYIYHLSRAKSGRDAAVNRMEMSPSTLRDRMKYLKIAFNEPTTNQGSKNEEITQ